MLICEAKRFNSTSSLMTKQSHYSNKLLKNSLYRPESSIVSSSWLVRSQISTMQIKF